MDILSLKAALANEDQYNGPHSEGRLKVLTLAVELLKAEAEFEKAESMRYLADRLSDGITIYGIV
jgi:hypothetical protein